jgi:hypothetical protein
MKELENSVYKVDNWGIRRRRRSHGWRFDFKE